jgi:hypothetical protein
LTPIRVLHCPETVGGNPGQLARAERALGLDSVSIAFDNRPFAYEVDEVLWQPGDGPLRHELKRWSLLRRALRDFDVVHFNFGSSIMPRRVPLLPEPQPPVGAPLRVAYGLYARLVELRDLPLLRRAGKGIVVTYQGDDARQGDDSRERYDLSLASVPGYFGQREDEAKRRHIAVFDRYADRIFALNPDLLAVLPDRAEFLPYASVDPAAWVPSFRQPTEVVRIVHAPSNRRAKGTEHVVAAVERLQAENVPVELELVEGLTHVEAQRLYAQADIVVDQLLVGWYGGFAVEMMALGKPVVAYVRDEDLVHIPDAMRAELPVISATPDTITDVLRRLVTDEGRRLPELGRRGRAYVERWHDPRAIAGRLKGVYEEIMQSRR